MIILVVKAMEILMERPGISQRRQVKIIHLVLMEMMIIYKVQIILALMEVLKKHY